MFGLWKKSRRKISAEQKARIDFHYPKCVRAITSYINEHPNPTEDDVLRIAINAKVMYELFRKVDGSRDFASPLILNGATVLSERGGMALEEAAMRMKELVQDEVNQLARGGGELTLPAIKWAYIMAQLVGFDEQLPYK